MTTDYDSVDYFTDPSLVPDPHPYYDHIRAKDPVCCPINNGVLAVTGWEAANTVYKDTESYSSCVAVMGPFTPIPFVPEGDDICAQLEEHRTEIPMFEHMVTMDPPQHTDARSILSRLLTPKRLKENEDFMWRLADRHIDEFIADGRCEFLAAYAKPFSPLGRCRPARRPRIRSRGVPRSLRCPAAGTNIGGLDHEVIATNPLAWADEKFSQYIEERRESPRDDVLTSIATAKYPDGSTPEVFEVVRTATFLFAAGQETTAKLLGAALRVLGDRPDIQQQLRDDRSLIPSLHRGMPADGQPGEERFPAGPQDDDARRHPGAGGHHCDGQPGRRQPRCAPVREPARVPLDRKNVREHIAFSRGIHSCPGAPLARVEGRVSIERHPRPAGRHHHQRGEARSDRCAQLRLRADLHPARAHRTEHQFTPAG